MAACQSEPKNHPSASIMKEINSVNDFYKFLAQSSQIKDEFERTKLISKQLSALPTASIVNYEKYFRKELIRYCHYNFALLYELQYPSPIFLKNGKPVDNQEPYLSTDGFIYFRCGVVLLGKEIADSIMHNPESVIDIYSSPPTIDAESLLYVSHEAQTKRRQS
jgi:hypothetical protein